MRAQLMDRPIQTARRQVAPMPENEWRDARSRRWQAKASAHYHATVGDMSRQMRRRLARRLFEVTGAMPAIVVDSDARWAMAMVDGVMFLLRGNDLVVLRHCAHCQSGRFESASIMNQDDLGYALAAWQPYHPECAPTDPPDDISW